MSTRTRTPEQLNAAAERKAQFRALVAQIAKLPPAERAAVAAKMPAVMTCEGRTLSVTNQCLIMAQCPTVTIVGGFRQWLRAGRCVRKGEHGLALWVPGSRKGTAEADGADDTAEADSKPFFIMGTVFDVAQTYVLTEQAAA